MVEEVERMPTVELSQGRIHYSEDGEGPAVVLLHGAFVGGALWRKVVAQLHGTHRVIVPELPLGAHPIPLPASADVSPPGVARMVAELLERLDLEDVTLAGNDTGGAIAQLVAAHHPERIGRLVLVNCDMLEVFPPAFFKPLMAAVRVPGVLAALARTLRVGAIRNSPLAFGWLTKKGIPDDVAQAWADAAKEPGVRNDLLRFVKGADVSQTQQAADLLAQRDLPILLPWGQDDRFFRPELARRFAARMRDARIEPIADSYCFVPEDQPGALSAAISRFVAETARTPAPH
jgi:pimeloyl-ACP methyl ester carboxylesterase